MNEIEAKHNYRIEKLQRKWNELAEYKNMDKLKEKMKGKKKRMRWQPPAPRANWFQINFDCSIWQDGSVTLGFIIRNDKGELVHAGAEVGWCLSPVLSEALTLRLAIFEEVKLSLLNI